MTPSLPASDTTASVTRVCEHAWCALSRHTTSLGIVVYVRCARCGGDRVDLLPYGERVPEGISREVPRR